MSRPGEISGVKERGGKGDVLLWVNMGKHKTELHPKVRPPCYSYISSIHIHTVPTLLKVLFMKQRIPQSEILEIKAYPQLRNKDMQEDIISTEFATYVTDFVFAHGICIFCYKFQTLNDEECHCHCCVIQYVLMNI